jgi:hypothetical protein
VNVATLAKTGDEPVWSAAQAADGQPQFPAQLVEVLTAAILQLAALEQIPDALIRVELRRVTRQAFQVETGRRPGGEEVLHRLAMMDRRAVPDHEQLPPYLAEELAEEGDDRRTPERLRLEVREEPAGRCDGADRGEMITRERGTQDGRLAHGGIGARHEGEEIEAGLVYEEDRAPLLPGFA